MDEDLELKHACKFCNKSFPCGRSLGGHMRSHMTTNNNNNNNNNNSAETDEKLTKKKLISLINGGNNKANSTETSLEAAGINSSGFGYILRENPKKTWRLADSSEEASLQDKFCKECGKGFPSWKALFGHMKCHSEKERLSTTSLEEQDSSVGGANQKQNNIMDSQSDNETAAPSKKRRSKRRTRYMGSTTANSSSFSLANNNHHASSSMSEIEQEQEEVAMCLMMLSRDVGHWGGFNSVAESSDNNSVFLEAKLDYKVKASKEVLKLKKQRDNKLTESCTVGSSVISQAEGRPEFCASGISRNGPGVADKSKNGSFKKDKDGQFGAEDSEAEEEKNMLKQTGTDQAQMDSSRCISSKRRSRDSYNGPELKSDSWKKQTNHVLDSAFYKDPHKRSKFECTTCNKTFHSYQALGGHRASHKKIKGCFASRIDSTENEIAPDQTSDSKQLIINIKSISNEIPTKDHHLDGESDEKKSKGHECPICLKVFPSGQALGGHKRSHLVNEASRDSQTIVIEKPIPEIRDFLDLNLPAPVEEETSALVGFKPWWVGRGHKHEALVGLISN